MLTIYSQTRANRSQWWESIKWKWKSKKKDDYDDDGIALIFSPSFFLRNYHYAFMVCLLNEFVIKKYVCHFYGTSWNCLHPFLPLTLFLYISIDFVLRVADLLASFSQNKKELLNGIKWGRVNGKWGKSINFHFHWHHGKIFFKFYF